MGNIFKCDIGTKIIVAVGFNISSASVVKIYYRKPNGATGSWDATKEGDNVSISFTTTTSGELDVAGVWTLQAYVEISSWKGYGNITTELIVYEPLATKSDTLTEGTNTWILLEDADDYFRTRVGATRIWDETVDKISALVTAYNQLNGCGLFEFPSTITGNMKYAQCEMALFILRHQEDIDARMGLQAQGVVQAGIVQETYDSNKIDGIPIPANVKQLLNVYESSSGALGIVEISRDDDEDIE